MNITSQEIRNKNFSKKLRGVDGNEVALFLRDVAYLIDDVTKENNLLKNSLSELEEKVKEYQAIEKNIQQVLIEAKEISSQVVRSAQQYGEDAKNAANKNASLIVEQAHSDLLKLNEAIEIAETKYKNIIGYLKNFLLSELSDVQNAEKQIVNTSDEQNFSEQKVTQNIDNEAEEIANKILNL